MRLKLSSLGPTVSLVMMVNIAKQQAGCRTVKDKPNIIINSNSEKILITRFFEAMEIHPQARRVDLKIERSVLDCLLLVRGKSSETIGKSIGDSEVHGPCSKLSSN